MAISWTDVVKIAPELVTLAVATQDDILADVNVEVDPAAWNEFADKGKKYLAAHLGTLARASSGAASGPVASETLGPMSRSYAVESSMEAGMLASTKYGVEYARIRRIAVGPGVIVP